MQKFNSLMVILVLALSACTNNGSVTLMNSEKVLFNSDWQFSKAPEIEKDTTIFYPENAISWENVSLPHTASIEPLVIDGAQWQGNCVYRKIFELPESYKEKQLALYFEGAMQVAEVYLNGNLVHTNLGGYLPFHIDITDKVRFTGKNLLVVKLNNEDNSLVPPGKPLADLDFNIFSGIYRNVWLQVANKLHITDVMAANKVAGGGIFVTYDKVSNERATIHIVAEVANNYSWNKSTQIRAMLFDKNQEQVAVEVSKVTSINSGEKADLSLMFELTKPELWSTQNPALYKLQVEVLSADTVYDVQTLAVGIRTFKFTAKNGFELNGKPIKIRGTNRHQEYPYIGYALSDNANYRDAFKIKEAGFNMVRLSHYPHSESFLKACNELGLLVMDAIPGWQFFGNQEFQNNALNDVRKMVRRDRNHPSIILWEASLNESGMTTEFMEQAHQAVHEEYPHPDVYTCGWLDTIYDVFIPARQHAKPPHYWNSYSKNKPIFIAEYGDWEYYAQNAGFNQKAFKNLSEEERTSRQLRGHGARRLAQQALNYQEAHNSNLAGPAVGDANWLMYDYNRGYAPDLEASGIMDIFRLPKFAYYFYKSQADISESTLDPFGKPMVAISGYYNNESDKDLKIYSNCEQVRLFVNDSLIGTQLADQDVNSTHLPHPPFTFKMQAFIPGIAVAQGLVNNSVVVADTVKTPEKATTLKLWYDKSGKALQSGVNDVVFLYAAIVDKNGTVVPDATPEVNFIGTGDFQIIGRNPIEAEAGIATVILKVGSQKGIYKLEARAEDLTPGTLDIVVE
ncbi:MAG: glycoside hydrolase family 2 TIM barrel-domain containing protein [Salinivirgaceae bacterium]